MTSDKQPIIPVEEQFKIMADSAPVLIWISGVDKLCYFFNTGWLRFTGRTLEQEYGNGWAEGVHTEDLARCLKIYINSFDERKEFKMEYRLKRHDGIYRWILDTGVPRYASNGDFAGYIGSCIDIDELLESERIKQEHINAKLQIEQEANEILEAKVVMRVAELSASEARFKSLIRQAPVAIAVLHGRELIVESANEMILGIWGKSENVIGKNLVDALPELKGQPFLDILDQVFTTGKPFYGDEVLAKLEHQGQLQDIYVNFVYQPFFDDVARLTDIMVVAVDVTEQVKARAEVERVYEQARLSKEAARMGTFDMDLLKGTMEWDERCRTLFGINHKEKVTYEKDFVTGLHPDDRERVLNLIKDVFSKEKTDGVYDVEYRTIGAEDQKIRWVRAKGQVYFDNGDQPLRFIGSVLEITEQKQDEQRKNDFIGMVSHELKTPLTSLNALLQVAQQKLKITEDPFLKTAMDKANAQVKKMTGMINGFLNLSRFESSKLHLNFDVFELDEVLREVIEETEIISKQEITFLPGDPITVRADKDKISHVVTSILL